MFLAAGLVQGIWMGIASGVVVCWHVISSCCGCAPLVVCRHYIWGVGVPIVVPGARYALRC